jgi:hypothetical protein
MIFQNCWNTFEVANVRMSTFIGMLKWTKKNWRVKKIFWSHTSQRAECRDFGDIITFDTTHKTNKHSH